MARVAGLLAVLMAAVLVGAPAVGEEATTTTGPPATTAAVPVTTGAPTGTTVAPTETTATTEPPVPPTVAVAVGRERFSPNRDGVADRVLVRVTPNGPVTLELTVRRAGVVVKTLETDLAVGAGTTTFEWWGRTDDGGHAADGTYNVRALVTAEDGATAAATTPVTVDTTPPRFGWISLTPDPLLGAGPLSLRFNLRGESERVSLRLAAQDRFGVVARRDDGLSRPPGERSVGWRPRYRSGRQLIPGLYLLQVVATDDVGNRTGSPLRRFRVHRPVGNTALSSVPGAGHRVGLSFDDCGDGTSWSRILDTLDARNVHATFFCIGASVSRYPAQARRTVRDGHTVGSHTPDHEQVTHLTGDQVFARLRRDQATWWNVARTTPSPFWRTPYGEHSSTAQAAAGRAGFRWTVFWNIDPRNWDGPSSGTITSHVLSRARAGSIVVMHTFPATAGAVNGIITGLRARGLEPSSLSELVHAAGIDRR